MEKQEKIIKMFDEIAPTYDKANRILSMGIDISWRKTACEMAFKKYNKNEIDLILDIACGTGDMMMFWDKFAKEQNIKVKKILGIDPSVGMLEVGKTKLRDFEFKVGEASNLPLKDEVADILSISYGIRNVIKRKDAFSEFRRVLKKDGLVVILEFTKDDKKGLFYGARNFYLNKILPKIGGFISKNKAAYEYLPNSIDGFLTSDLLTNELKELDFEIEFTKGFSMDISTLIIARKK